jgi:oxygen-independent coproporphyrinogen-3 oxidase
MYSLTIEKGTPFYQSKKRGILKLPQDESVLEMISTIDNTLQLGGLNRYEISNFAKPGFESRHNLAYWNQDDYLGIGAGAHSYCKQSVNKTSLGTRWSNFAFPQKYIESTTSTGFAQSWSEELSLKSAIFEFFFLGLRKINGVSLKHFESEFKVSIDSCYGDLIDILTSEGWLVRNDDFIALSTKGINVADSIIENFCDPNI